jgi:hypothetical protein
MQARVIAIAAQLGHKSLDYRTTELYAAFDPAYLSNAVGAIDKLFDELRASFAPVDEVLFRPVSTVYALNAYLD